MIPEITLQLYSVREQAEADYEGPMPLGLIEGRQDP